MECATDEINVPELDPESRLAMAILLRAMLDWRNWCQKGQACPDHEWPWPYLAASSELFSFFTSGWFEDLCVGLRIGRDTLYAYLAEIWRQAQDGDGSDS